MDPRMIVVVAVADNGVIGCDGKLPWHLASDMQRFKTLTTGHTVIMGRNTWESLPAKFRPLPDRTNIVLSRQKGYKALGAIIFESLDAALNAHKLGQVICVIGGQKVYEEAIWKADEVHLTRVHASPDGDAYFPIGDLEQRFVMTESFRFQASTVDDHDFTFVILNRTLPDRSYVYLPNARQPKQWAVMERIQLDGMCPFCPEHLAKYHTKPILNQTDGWLLTENQWPYQNTRVHLMLISRRHLENVTQLTDQEWTEVGFLLRQANKRYRLTSAGLGLRFGEPAGNGGTVRHLHIQLLSAEVTDPADKNYKKVHLSLN